MSRPFRRLKDMRKIVIILVNVIIIAAILIFVALYSRFESKKHVGVGKYSLGMRQRLGLAQAIMEDPDILILDEPMNGLDNDGVSEMRDYLLALKASGKTIIIASHSAEDIAVLCDTVHEMNKGVLTTRHRKNCSNDL